MSMSRLDVLMGEKMERERQAVLLAVYGGLEAGVSKAGGELLGISVKLGQFECLLTLRAEFPAGPVVGFITGDGLAEVLKKAASAAARDGVKWRADKWRENGG